MIVAESPTHAYLTDNSINIRIAGRGGQGIIKAGLLLAEALVLEGKNVAQTQNYGPEARGGACRTDIVASLEEIDYPGLQRIDYLIVLDEGAYARYLPMLNERTIVIYDSDLVKSAKKGYGFPFTRISKDKFGSELFANMIALGAFVSLTDIVKPETLQHVIKKRMKNPEKNISAFRLGAEIAIAPEIITR